jgi:DNA-binding CsgD family transcriptional regulator
MTRCQYVAWPPTLTPREREVLVLLAGGYEYQHIGVRLVISEHTVRSHVNIINKKFYAENSGHAVILALKSGVIRLDEVEPLSDFPFLNQIVR